MTMPTFPVPVLDQLSRAIFQACGASEQEAAIVAEHLVTSCLMGIESHGLMRIPQYVELVQEQAIRPRSNMVIEEETVTTAVVDCALNFGPVGAIRALEVAMDKAHRQRVSCVVTRRCNHAGRLGAYPQRAAENGFITLAFCNSPPHGHFVLPWGGRQARLATNPISYAIPSLPHPILADFSTAVVPEGKVRLYHNQGRPLPKGWIVDAQGHPSTNTADFYAPTMGAILPFGGEMGHRGYALSLLVEIMGGMLAGYEMTLERPGNGVAFIVIDVEAFLPSDRFAEMVEDMKRYVKSSPPAEGFEEVLLPGELEFRLREKRLREGIPLDEVTWKQIKKTAAALGVKLP
jgi:uncharacterized oxidoreductase